MHTRYSRVEEEANIKVGTIFHSYFRRSGAMEVINLGHYHCPVSGCDQSCSKDEIWGHLHSHNLTGLPYRVTVSPETTRMKDGSKKTTKKPTKGDTVAALAAAAAEASAQLQSSLGTDFDNLNGIVFEYA